MKYTGIAGLTIMMLLGGCAGPAITSRHVEYAGAPLRGLAYSLPKRDVVLTIIRCTAEDTSAAKILAAQQRCKPPALIADEGSVVTAPADTTKKDKSSGAADEKGDAGQSVPPDAGATSPSGSTPPKGDSPAKKPVTKITTGTTPTKSQLDVSIVRLENDNTVPNDARLAAAASAAEANEVAIAGRNGNAADKAENPASAGSAGRANPKTVAADAADVAASIRKSIATATSATTGCSPQNYVYGYSISVMPFEPDAGALFVADFKHSEWRDDVNAVEVGPNGLLTSANAEATGRASDVIVTLAGTVASLVTLAGGAPPNFLEERLTTQPECIAQDVVFRQRFDALEGPDQINDDLKNSSLPFAISVRPDSRAASDFANDPGYGPNKDVTRHPELVGGLFYRTVVPANISLFQCAEAASCSASGGRPVEAAMALVPRRSPVFFVPMRGSGFGKNTSKLAFDHGLLTSWSQSRPSGVLEVARIPGAVLDQVFGSISKVIQLRIDTSTKEKSLGEARLQLLQQQADLNKIQACVVAAAGDKGKAVACFSTPAASPN